MLAYCKSIAYNDVVIKWDLYGMYTTCISVCAISEKAVPSCLDKYIKVRMITLEFHFLLQHGIQHGVLKDAHSF